MNELKQPDETPVSPPKPHRLLRFSLRTLLLLTAVIAVWLGIQSNSVTKQRELEQFVLERGGSVTHTHRCGDWRQYWLDKLGKQYAFSITSVAIEKPLNEDEIRYVAERFRCCPHYFDLRLKVSEISVDGLLPLGSLKQLGQLHLSGRSVTDASITPLCSLSELHVLGLSNTSITDDAIQKIVELQSLGDLRLDGTNVTEAGIRQLKRLPNLYWLDVSDSISPRALNSLPDRGVRKLTIRRMP